MVSRQREMITMSVLSTKANCRQIMNPNHRSDQSTNMIRSLLVFLFFGIGTVSAQSVGTHGSKTLPLPGEAFQLDGHDGFAFLPPVDHYGEKGRNGFGLADMYGGVWEFTLDHFDPSGGHEEIHYESREQLSVSTPVCRGGNYFDVPGNARCAVRLGIHGVSYSDSRDGFRICLGFSKKTVPQER
jgi:hypothetical protein